MKRLGVLLVSLALFVLLAEGVLSLAARRSLRDLLPGRRALQGLEGQAEDSEELLEALRERGLYRTAVDPLVRLTYRADDVVEVAGVAVPTDDVGMARRPGPPPAEDAFRIVVLGDSVAFGQGLEPGRNLGGQLEELLRDVAPAGARPVVCLTVALPGWNARNATRALLDRLDRYRPDLVLYVPVENDLDDSFTTNEAGHRQRAPDPGVPRPLCVVAPPLEMFRVLGREALGLRGMAAKKRDIDEWALFGMLTGSARWRLDDMVARLARLAERLDARGARLVLAPYAQHDLHRLARAGLLARGVDVPVVPLLERLLAADGQGKDPHPNETTTRALAVWCARGLVAEGLLPFAPARPLPEVPAGFADRGGRELGADELREWVARHREQEAARLEPRIVPRELTAFLQIYGGVNADGTLGIEAACVLPPGRTLVLELEAVADAPGLYPLELRPSVDGVPLAPVVLPRAGEVLRRELSLPPGAARAPFELRIEAGDWAMGRVLGRLTPFAARLVSVESVP